MMIGKKAPPITDLRPLLLMLEAVRTEVRAMRAHAAGERPQIVAEFADKSDQLAAAALPPEEETTDE